jgi:hypothetical protein
MPVRDERRESHLLALASELEAFVEGLVAKARWSRSEKARAESGGLARLRFIAQA